MAMTTNVSEAVKPSIEVGKSEVTELIRGSYEKNGQFSNPEELFLAEELVEIFYETELPRFGVTHITTVKNETVKEKADVVLGLLEITTHAIPLYQQREFPLKFDEDTLKKAPWVNMIHAWMK